MKMFDGKMWTYEKARLKQHRKIIIFVLVAFFCLFAIVAITYIPIKTTDAPQSLTETEISEAFDFYQEKVQEIKADLEKGLDYKNEPYSETAKAHLQREMEEYEFYLKTKTQSQDYLKPSLSYPKRADIAMLGYVFEVMQISLYPMMIVAMGCGIFAFGFESSRKTLKNLIASPIDRSKIFATKFLCYLPLSIALPVLHLVLLTLLSLLFPVGVSLQYSNGYYALSMELFVLQRCITFLAISVFVYCLSVLVSTKAQPLTTFLSMTTGYFFLGIVSMLVWNVSQFLNLPFDSFSTYHLSPIIGLQNYNGGVDFVSTLLILGHLAVSGVFAFCAFKVFDKKDI